MRALSSPVVGALLLIGALARAIALPLPGTEDVRSWKVAALGGTVDLTAVYGLHGQPPYEAFGSIGGEWPPAYPVTAVMELAAAGRVYRLIHPEPTDSPWLGPAVKLPGIFAEAAFVAAIFFWSVRAWAARRATWMALAFWLNPAIWLHGAVLGYVDAQMAVPAVLALVAAAGGRPVIAGVLLAIGMLTKPQAVFVLPALLLLLRSRAPAGRTMIRLMIAAALTGVVVVLPFVIRGALVNLIEMTHHFLDHDMVSGNAANVWWLVAWFGRAVHHAPDAGWWASLTMPASILRISTCTQWGYPDPRLIGWPVVCGLVGWAAWRARRGLSLASSMWFAAWTMYAYAMFAPNVHENHLYLALPCLVIAAGLDWRASPILWATSAVFALNLYLFYGFGESLPPHIDGAWTIIDPTVWLAAASFGVFLWFTRRFAQVINESVVA